MSAIEQKGGMFKGNSHDNGGIPLVVAETGQHIEVEGDEPLIPAEAIQSDQKITVKGTNKQIIDKLNTSVGAKTTNEKATEVHAADFIVCKRSAKDGKVRKIKGTPKQIISAVNASCGCKNPYVGAEMVEFGQGGGVYDNCPVCSANQKLFAGKIEIRNKLTEFIKAINNSVLNKFNNSIQKQYNVALSPVIIFSDLHEKTEKINTNFTSLYFTGNDKCDCKKNIGNYIDKITENLQNKLLSENNQISFKNKSGENILLKNSDIINVFTSALKESLQSKTLQNSFAELAAFDWSCVTEQEKQKLFTGGELATGIKIEKEHKNLYEIFKKDYAKRGVKMPVTETKFYEIIASAHIAEDKNYYKKLLKYVEKMAGGGEISPEIALEIEKLKKLPYRDFLRHINDSYKDLNAEIGVKGQDRDGEDIYGYLPLQYDYMYQSAITGQNIRFYVNVGKGKQIHPSEVTGKFNYSEQKRYELAVDQRKNQAERDYKKFIEKLKLKGELEGVAASFKTALANGFEIVCEYDSSDITNEQRYCHLKKDFGDFKIYPSLAEYHTNRNEKNTYFGFKHLDYVTGNPISSMYLNPDLIRFKKDYVDDSNPTPELKEGGSTQILLAPNGKPSNLTQEQYKLVRTHEFKNWFGDWLNDPENASKVVDENGEPLVVYHGTYKKFYKFEIEQKLGAWFTPNKKIARHLFNRKQNIVIECFLNLKNPKTIKSTQSFTENNENDSWLKLWDLTNGYTSDGEQSYKKQLIKERYDGIVLEKSKKDILEEDWKNAEGVNQIIAFSPAQIKLADGTNTTFDSENPDIRFDEGGDLENSKKRTIFANGITKKDIQNVISGKSEISKGTVIKAASDYLRNRKSTDSEASKQSILKQQEVEILKDFITENNLWLLHSNLGTFVERGAEQKVYFKNDDYVYKTNDCHFYVSWIDYFNSLLLNNYFFPETSYELVGFVADGNLLFSVVKQPFIQDTDNTNLAEVKRIMLENGFVNTKNNDYFNPELGLILEDLHEDNVLTKNGVLYFIDTVFYISDSEKSLKNGGKIKNSDYIIIPNEQTPEVKPITDVKKFIKKYSKQINDFLLFAKSLLGASGLSANQVSFNGKRLMYRMFACKEGFSWRLIINPTIENYIGEKSIKTESCLSWECKSIVMERSQKIKVSYYTIDGDKIIEERSGFNAQIWQHEIDHLNGVKMKIKELNSLEKNICENVIRFTGGGEPISASIFSIAKTGIPYYDNIIEKSGLAGGVDDGYFYWMKGVVGKIEYMSPEEYLFKVRIGFKSTKNENILDSSKEKIKTAIEQGNKIDMPMLNYTNNKFEQEGRNRASVAIDMGIKEIPVFILNDVSKEIKNIRAFKIIGDANRNSFSEESFWNYVNTKYGQWTETYIKHYSGINDLDDLIQPVLKNNLTFENGGDAKGLPNVIDLSNDNKLVKNSVETHTLGEVTFYKIINSKGKQLGYIELTDRADRGFYQVGNVEIYNTRKGVGLDVYTNLIQQLDKPIQSDPSKSNAVIGLWEKLINLGLAEKFVISSRYGNLDMYRSIKKSPGFINITLPADIINILKTLNNANHETVLIGGCVRDAILNIKPKDWDIEVYNISYEELLNFLKPYGNVGIVGKAFGVIKFKPFNSENDYDFSVPRKENKIGIGHKGFETIFDKNLTVKEASARRDFTFNSISYNPIVNVLYDYYGGVADLHAGIIRHTSEAFSEDYLRILRAMQFQARYGFTVANETMVLMREMLKNQTEYNSLAKERISEEWMKWAVKGKYHHLVFDFLNNSGLINYYPELAALKHTEQDAIFHPEGNVETHTTMALAEMDKSLSENIPDETKAILIFAILCHDFGKPETTKTEMVRGRETITSKGHEPLSGVYCESFLKSIGIKESIIVPTVNLVSNHLANINLSAITNRNSKLKAIRKLSRKLYPATIEQLLFVINADYQGRGVKADSAKMTGYSDLMEMSKELDLTTKSIQPIMMGRHLIELGLKPSREFGEILEAALEAQDSGEIVDVDSGMLWLKEHVENIKKFNTVKMENSELNKKEIRKVKVKNEIVTICDVNATAARTEFVNEYPEMKDWNSGGHHFGWGKGMEIIPEGENWVDDSADPKAKQGFILHEILEYYNMKYNGMPYEKAHEISNETEQSYLKDYDNLEDKDPIKYLNNSEIVSVASSTERECFKKTFKEGGAFYDYNYKTFMKFAFNEIAGFLNNKLSIVLDSDWTFEYDGKMYAILALPRHETTEAAIGLLDATFTIISEDSDETVGVIKYIQNGSEKPFTFTSEHFGLSGTKFETGGAVEMADVTDFLNLTGKNAQYGASWSIISASKNITDNEVEILLNLQGKFDRFGNYRTENYHLKFVNKLKTPLSKITLSSIFYPYTNDSTSGTTNVVNAAGVNNIFEVFKKNNIYVSKGFTQQIVHLIFILLNQREPEPPQKEKHLMTLSEYYEVAKPKEIKKSQGFVDYYSHRKEMLHNKEITPASVIGNKAQGKNAEKLAMDWLNAKIEEHQKVLNGIMPEHIKTAHYNAVKKAVADNLDIPETVLAEYPEFAKNTNKKQEADKKMSWEMTFEEYFKSLQKEQIRAYKNRDVAKQDYILTILYHVYESEIKADNSGKEIRKYFDDANTGILRNSVLKTIKEKSTFDHVSKVLKQLLEKAVSEEKNIPSEVLADYPEFAKKENKKTHKELSVNVSDLPEKVFMRYEEKGEKPDSTWFHKKKNGYETVKFVSGKKYKKSFEEVTEHLKKHEKELREYIKSLPNEMLKKRLDFILQALVNPDVENKEALKNESAAIADEILDRQLKSKETKPADKDLLGFPKPDWFYTMDELIAKWKLADGNVQPESWYRMQAKRVIESHVNSTVLNYMYVIKSGNISASDAVKVIESAGLEVPKDILEMVNDCKIGEKETHNSRVVEGKYIESETEVIHAFDSAYKLMEHLKNIDSKDMSMHGVEAKYHLKFKVPMWYNENEKKLYFEYKEDADCPYRYVDIKQKTKEINPDISLQDALNYVTELR